LKHFFDQKQKIFKKILLMSLNITEILSTMNAILKAFVEKLTTILKRKPAKRYCFATLIKHNDA